MPLDFASIDVSFISLSIIIPALVPLLKQGGKAVCLIKPQFEAGKEKVGKKGVVRDPAVHKEVILKILDVMQQNSLSVLGLDYSPVKGPEGNIEYLILVQKNMVCEAPVNTDVDLVISSSHNELDK